MIGFCNCSDTPTPTSRTPPGEESTDSSLMEDEVGAGAGAGVGAAKPRKRRLHLPFGKSRKTPA